MANILHVREEQVANTAGGASTTATDHTRVLNTVVTNDISGASLATNQITLPAGTYDVVASAPGHDTNAARSFLYNVTDAAVEVLGHSSTNMGTSDASGIRASVYGRFTIAAEKVFELRYFVQTGKTVDGLGLAVNDTRTEIFSEVIIQEVV